MKHEEPKPSPPEPRTVATVVELMDNGHMLVALGPGAPIDVEQLDGVRVGDRVFLDRQSVQPLQILRDETPTGTIITVERVHKHLVESLFLGQLRTFRSAAFPGLRVGERVVIDPSSTFVIGTMGMPPAKHARPPAVSVSWDDVGGQDEAKEALREAIELPYAHPHLFKQYGMTASKGVLLWGPPGGGKTLMSKAAATALARSHGKAATDGFIYVKGPELINSFIGKCLGIGTPILMHDGTIKKVEDVVAGNLVMGPDSQPRRVESLKRGRAPLYRVHPAKGDSWVCNEDHVLTIVGHKTHRPEMFDIAVKDFLALTKTEQGNSKLVRVGCEFPTAEQPIEPYLMGLWLGDGSVHNPAITTIDQEVIDYCVAAAARYELRAMIRDNTNAGSSAKTVYMVGKCEGPGVHSNPLLNAFRTCLNDNVKFVSPAYLVANREQRMDLLAGLLDTDGHLDHDRGFEITTKSEPLRDGILFLARSLGFAATSHEVQKGIKSRGFVGTYQRIWISGDVHTIPTRIPHKKAKPIERSKRVNTSGFDLEPIGVGDYYGFTLDGDHRFLLGDFTVTHNSEENIRNLFAAAREHKAKHGYPALVFIDECDALLGMRDRSAHTSINATVVPQFLAEMDGLDDHAAMFILATNRPDMLDPAVVRDGRIDRRVKVTRPSRVDAVAILKIHMRGRPLHRDSLETIIGRATEALFDDARVVRELGDGVEPVRLRDLVNGALIAGAIGHAATRAMRRDIATSAKLASGISADDVVWAIDRAQSTLRDTDVVEAIHELAEAARQRQNVIATVLAEAAPAGGVA